MSVVSKHRLEDDHEFDWTNVHILHREDHLEKREIAEMVFIKRHNNTLNLQKDTKFRRNSLYIFLYFLFFIILSLIVCVMYFFVESDYFALDKDPNLRSKRSATNILFHQFLVVNKELSYFKSLVSKLIWNNYVTQLFIKR
ncbi:hypothetical protein X777_07894 [Ooceraea biroi]|uniref:Uncharacterized protein n=1 Tax=Ooceraea biroi TaxID=2015173 RepID=A0A026X0N0_OOCBI|nr:hypothetical protein X777_07894 [Ooceraea biroi]